MTVGRALAGGISGGISLRAAAGAWAIASAYGASDEWHQSFVPGRKPGVDDWLFDTHSGGLAIYAWQRLWRSQRRLRGALLE